MEATNIEVINKDATKKKGKASQRGRSKKKGSSKSKEPFRHIGSHLVPSVAIAHASPTYVSKSRSPSPVARAIQFISRIGQAIPAGKRLQRSLSEQDVSRSLQSNKLIESKRLSQSNPGPSGLQEIHDDDNESEAGYDRIDDVRRRAGMLSDEADGASPMAKRPPMPLPDEADNEETRRSKSIEDLYSKVIKHSTKQTKVEQLQKQAEPNYDSDDITSVSEIDEDTTSKVALSNPHARKSRTKSLEVPGEDTSDGPSEGEVYKPPVDALHNDKSSGMLFETIEELDNEDSSVGSKRAGDGVKSPGSGHSKASFNDQGGHPVIKKTRSVSSLNSDQDKRSPRPHTPRDFGKEAALRRLEEIGFDAMCSEFGFQNSNSQHSDIESDFDGKQEERLDYFAEEAPSIVDASMNESAPPFHDEKQYYESSLGSPEKSAFVAAQRSKESSLRSPKRDIVIEEPQVRSTEAFQQSSSHELRLEELVDESFDDSRQEVSPKFVPSDQQLQQRVISENRSEKGLQSARSDLAEDVDDEVAQKDIAKQMKVLKRDVARLARITDEELRRQRDTRKRVTENQARMEEDVVLRGRSPLSSSRSNPTEGSYHVDGKQSFEEQRRVQLDMRDRQDRILEMIEALESQVKKLAKVTLADKNGIEEEEQLLTLRKLILEEQRKYNEQQKVLEEQQNKILEAQRHLTPKKTKRSQSRFSTSPVSSRKSDGRMISRQDYAEQPDQFRILENRLKTVEAERQALLDLNASLQDENDALKRLALHHDQGDSSGIIYKKQNKDLTESNNNLKTLVHRLNVELSRYQAKYRPPRRDEIGGLSLPEEGPIPQWLVNIKYLSPLIMAYDDRLKDKNEVIRAYETQLASFKARMLDIVRENQRLHMVNSERPDDNGIIAFHEWNLLQEQAKLVLEENSILMQEIDLKDRRIDEIQDEFQSEVTRLTKRLRLLENEKKNAHASLTSLQMESELWKKKFEEISEESRKKVSQEEMERKLEDVKRSLSANVEILQREKDLSSQQYKAVSKEKQELAVKLTDATAKGAHLQLEIDFTTNALRKAEKKLTVMQNKVETAKEREMMATETLTQVLSVAERNERERDDLARMIQAQNNESVLSYQQLDLAKSHVQKYKKMSKQKDAEVSIRMKEKDEEILNLKNSYNKEISNLKDACRQRQNMLDHIQSDKSHFEHGIDDLWKSITDENEQLKKSITR